MTSRMLATSPRSISSRSTPSPKPDVGGNPYSRARRYSSSTSTDSSSSPAARLGRLLLEAGPLVVGVDQLGEPVAELAAGHHRLVALDQLGAVAVAARQRRHLGRVVDDEHRAPQPGLGRLLVDLEQDLARAPRRFDVRCRPPSATSASSARGERTSSENPVASAISSVMVRAPPRRRQVEVPPAVRQATSSRARPAPDRPPAPRRRPSCRCSRRRPGTARAS